MSLRIEKGRSIYKCDHGLTRSECGETIKPKILEYDIPSKRGRCPGSAVHEKRFQQVTRGEDLTWTKEKKQKKRSE